MMNPLVRFPTLPVNHDAFHAIDTHELAYLLGFLLADGCVRSNLRRVALRILAEDLKVCQMMQRVAGGNLRYEENGYRISWDATSAQMVRNLIALELTPRKSLTASLRWEMIPIEFHGSVLAGLIDGDGHMRFKPAKRQAEISVLTASAALRDQLLERFPFCSSVTIPLRGGRKRLLFNIGVSSNRRRLSELIETVYDPLPFTILDRKQRVLDGIRSYLATQEDYERQMADLPRMQAQGLTQQAISDSLGVSRGTVGKRLRSAGIDSKQVVFVEEDRQRMKQLHEEGLSVLQIHAVLGKATEQAVRYQLQRMGCLKKRPKQLPRHELADEILGLHLAGMPAYRIAEQLGITAEAASLALRREGICLRGGAPQKLTREMVVWADGELSRGRTLRSVSQELGVSGTLVKIRLRQLISEHQESTMASDQPSEEWRDSTAAH